MIIGVDIGGTKTLVAVFAENGKILKEVRFETNRNYDDFLTELKKHADTLETSKAKAACAAIPGLLNRRSGIVESLGNLPWKDKHIRHDISVALGVKDVQIENDSKLAGLSEARYISEKYKRVFYITISTGIGGALVVNGKLSKDVIDMEIGKAPFGIDGTVRHWEEFSSGRAFYEKYGKKAVDVDDDKIWEEFSKNINIGLGVICSAYQPEVIIFGGGLGQRLGRFKKHLVPYLTKNLHSIVRQPQELLPSHFRGQSVIYGCYEHAKDHLA
jgi:glucokinase